VADRDVAHAAGHRPRAVRARLALDAEAAAAIADEPHAGAHVVAVDADVEAAMGDRVTTLARGAVVAIEARHAEVALRLAVGGRAAAVGGSEARHALAARDVTAEASAGRVARAGEHGGAEVTRVGAAIDLQRFVEPEDLIAA
jgi:hypothetical protein